MGNLSNTSFTQPIVRAGGAKDKTRRFTPIGAAGGAGRPEADARLYQQICTQAVYATVATGLPVSQKVFETGLAERQGPIGQRPGVPGDPRAEGRARPLHALVVQSLQSKAATARSGADGNAAIIPSLRCGGLPAHSHRFLGLRTSPCLPLLPPLYAAWAPIGQQSTCTLQATEISVS